MPSVSLRSLFTDPCSGRALASVIFVTNGAILKLKAAAEAAVLGSICALCTSRPRTSVTICQRALVDRPFGGQAYHAVVTKRQKMAAEEVQCDPVRQRDSSDL
ncbi:hypothetical protein D918_09417 [Trichuris suis]|nr:hypothetical protein D918_09417 [Trichuris suis]